MNPLVLIICAVLAQDPGSSSAPAHQERAAMITNLERIADHALVSPQLNTSPLPEYDYDKLDYGMTIGIERTPGGRLWACWVAGGDSPEACFVLASSDDDGESWSPPRLVIDTHSSKGIMQSESSDGGRTWAEPSFPNIKHLPTFVGPTLGTLREVSIPTVDISGHTERHSIVAEGTAEVYHGHCDTVLLPNGKTMFTAWTVDHAQRVGPLARSEDAGRTWSAPIDVPANWHHTANTPAIHRLVDPKGKSRLIVFADGLDWRRGGKPPYPMHQAISEDDGRTWTPMNPNGIQGEVPPKTILAFDESKRVVLWSDLPGYVVQSESRDGGLTWARERRILRIPNRWGQPAVTRSPDGRQLLMLLRENSRRHHSLYSVSDDDAQTWSEPRELPASLTGDRHVMRYAGDGRLVVAMRDMAKTSQTYGHYVAWVGRYEDIVQRGEGQYRIKLLHNTARSADDKRGTGNTDCGYSDLEVLVDGSIVATTYIKYRTGPEKNSVVNTRFKLHETDTLLEQP